MRKAKFLVMQIVMVAIIGLVFGASAFAGGIGNSSASDTGKANASVKAGGDGGDPTRGHAGSHSSGGGNNNGSGDDGSDTGDGSGSGDPEAECAASGGIWFNNECF